MAFPRCSQNGGIPPSLKQHQGGQSPTTGDLTMASSGCCTWDTLAVCGVGNEAGEQLWEGTGGCDGGQAE